MRIVSTKQATQPKGHYSQAVVHNGVVYVSGQLATDLTDPDAPPGDMATQTRNVLGHVRKILEAAGSRLDLMLQATVFISDIDQWGAVNEAFGEILGDHRPTRAIIPVGTLPRGRLIEMQVIAALPEGA